MRLASYVLSITLHLGLVLVIFFWPSPPLIKLEAQSVQISLVDGAMGGNRMPSPVLGPQGAKGEKIAPPQPAPQKAEATPPAPAAQETPIAQPKPEVPEPKPQPKPKPKPEPEPEATPIAEKKKPDVKKPDPKPEPAKEEPKKPDPKKPETKQEDTKKPDTKKAETKAPAKPAVDPIKAALDKASKQASSREPAAQQGSAVTRALAEAKRKAGGFDGGGGGEGDGPGGGGLGDAYIGQVMMAVQPNWGFPSSSRQNLTCSVRVQVDAQGKVLRAELERSSGNSLFDTSTVNAVRKTGTDGQFPVPPNPQYFDLILVFNLNEMAGR